MSSANELNAITREQARIREGLITIVRDPNADTMQVKDIVYLRLGDVLDVVNNTPPVVKKTWPSNGDVFFRVNSQGNIIEAPWTDSPKQKSFLHYGNVFKTKEQAEKAREYIAEILVRGADRGFIKSNTIGYEPQDDALFDNSESEERIKG